MTRYFRLNKGRWQAFGVFFEHFQKKSKKG